MFIHVFHDWAVLVAAFLVQMSCMQFLPDHVQRVVTLLCTLYMTQPSRRGEFKLGGICAGGGGSATVAQVLECTYTGKTAVRRGALSLSQLSVSPTPLPIPLPFPCIFGPSISARGDILPNPIASTTGRGGADVLSIPVAARVTSSDSLLPYAKGRLTSFRKLGLSRASVGGGVLEDWGFAKEEAQDVAEVLGNLASAYNDRMHDSASDSD